jgi:hypothetical protein
MKDASFIAELLLKGREAGDRARALFNHMDIDQLNWKPEAGRWSIAQCLDHLVVSDMTYFPTLKKINAGSYKMSKWERWSPLSGFFGKMLVNQTQEKVTKKLNAPRAFQPSQSKIDLGILDRFHKHLDTLLEYIEGCKHVDIDKTYITSPAFKMVTYKLRHAMQILVQHERRHINQAIKVKHAMEDTHRLIRGL